MPVPKDYHVRLQLDVVIIGQMECGSRSMADVDRYRIFRFNHDEGSAKGKSPEGTKDGTSPVRGMWRVREAASSGDGRSSVDGQRPGCVKRFGDMPE